MGGGPRGWKQIVSHGHVNEGSMEPNTNKKILTWATIHSIEPTTHVVVNSLRNEFVVSKL